jgi:hypothetical protein
MLLTPVLMAVSMFELNALGQGPAPVKTTENLPPGAMQAKATTACTECHEARIIVQQRLSKAAWGKEVDKMMKWGAVVDPGDRDALIDYLSTNFNPDLPPYSPPRSASERTDRSGAKKNYR